MRLVVRAVVCLAIVCAVALEGCGSDAPTAKPKPRASPRAHARQRTHSHAPELVYLLISTGADPLGHEISVTRDGWAIAVIDAGRAGGLHREVRLSPAALARVRRLVRRTPLKHSDRSRIPTPGGSSYILRINHHNVVFSTGHVAPGVRPLLAVLLRLSARVSKGL